ncbi:MAG: FAD-dependent oxidoreductase, partial [Gammaproteobacteria bacterium]
MAKQQADYDVLIIGGGHNGLTSAGYLARAGYSVKVFEQRGIVGGAAITEEFHPGFRNSVCSYVVGLLNPKIIKDLELNKYGLEIMSTDEDNLLVPDEQGGALMISGDEEDNRRQIEALAPGDYDNWVKLHQVLEQCADVVRDIVLETPANIGGGLIDILRLAKVGNRMRKMDADIQH